VKINLADATGCPVPQFVVYPETLEEQMILKSFSHFYNDSEWRFVIYGFTHQHGTSRRLISG
jgi:hypothetical protein